MTEIDAINRMLRYIGELPVPTDVVIDSLEEGHEASLARTILSFDNIPDVFRTYVILVAAKHLHVYLNGDETTQRELEIKVNLQQVKVEREHLKQSKFNLIKGTRLIDRGTNPTALI